MLFVFWQPMLCAVCLSVISGALRKRQGMEPGDEALSLETVVVVACVCGSIVLVLTVVLIVLCCRRRQTKYFYEKGDANLGRHALLSSSESQLRSHHHADHQSSCNANITSCSSNCALRHLASSSHLNTTSTGNASSSGVEEKIGYNFTSPEKQSENYTRPSSGYIATAAGDDDDDEKMKCATLPSENRRQRKVIYEVIV